MVDPELAADLQETLEEFLDGWVPAGVSAAVLWPDGAFWEGAAGFADGAAGVPRGAGDPMVIGSTTKMFTATVVMQLVEEGALGLDDRVAAYFPDFGLSPDLTVRHPWPTGPASGTTPWIPASACRRTRSIPRRWCGRPSPRGRCSPRGPTSTTPTPTTPSSAC